MTTEPAETGIRISQDPAADALLARSPFALLVAMILDQNNGMERAFSGPYLLTQRIGQDLTPELLAGYDRDTLVKVFNEAPPLRSAQSSVRRVQSMATYIVERYDGNPIRLWTEITTGDELLHRIQEIPGYSPNRARVLIALLGKQFGITPVGWREAAAPYGDEGTRLSVADVTGPETLAEVRAARSEAKAGRKSGGPDDDAEAIEHDEEGQTESADQGKKRFKRRRRPETAASA